jgi:hypothetical protein
MIELTANQDAFFFLETEGSVFLAVLKLNSVQFVTVAPFLMWMHLLQPEPSTSVVFISNF